MRIQFLSFLAVVFFTCKVPCYSQDFRDSIFSELGIEELDSETVSKLYDFAYNIEIQQPRKAYKIYQEGIEISKQIDYELGAGKGIGYQGAVHFNLGEFDKAIQKYEEALDMVDTSKETRFKAVQLNNMGNAYNVNGDFGKAIMYYQSASIGFEKAKDSVAMLINKSNTGALLDRSGNYEEGIETLEEALVLAKSMNYPNFLADVYQNLGTIYHNIKDYQTSLDYQLLALDNYQEDKPEFIALTLSNISQNFLFLEQTDSAEKYILPAKDIVDTLDIPRQYAYVYGIYSNYLSTKGNFLQAERAAQIALDKLVDTKDPFTERSVLFSLLFALEGSKQYKKANPYFRKYIALQDSLNRLEKNEQFLTQRTLFRTAQKEKEIAVLTKQKALDQLAIQRQRYFITTGLVVFAVLALLGFFLLNNYRQASLISEQEKIIQEQKVKELEEHQKLLAFNATVKGQEEERIRIAKDLHDGIGGALAAVKMRLEAYDTQEKPLVYINQTRNMVDEAYGEVRRIAHNMSPYSLNQLGLVKALESMCRKIQESGNLVLDFQALRIDEGLPQLHEVMIYRIVQELINNVIKHAEAKEMLIQLSQENEELHLTAEDDGKGFAYNASAEGIGIKSIRSRVESLGGTFSIDSGPKDGTSIFITLPL